MSFHYSTLCDCLGNQISTSVSCVIWIRTRLFLAGSASSPTHPAGRHLTGLAHTDLLLPSSALRLPLRAVRLYHRAVYYVATCKNDWTSICIRYLHSLNEECVSFVSTSKELQVADLIRIGWIRASLKQCIQLWAEIISFVLVYIKPWRRSGSNRLLLFILSAGSSPLSIPNHIIHFNCQHEIFNYSLLYASKHCLFLEVWYPTGRI